MGRNVLDSCPRTDAIKDPNHADEMSVAPVRWKDEGRVVSFRLGHQEVDGQPTNNPDLLTGLGIRKTDALLLCVNPHSLHAEHLHLPKPGQQHGSDSGKAGRMLALLLHHRHGRAQPAEFLTAQPAQLLVAGGHADAQRRVCLDQAEPRGVTEHASQGADRPARYPSTARRLATAVSPLGTGPPTPTGDLGLQFLHIHKNDAPHKLRTHQRLDMDIDPTLIAVER